MTRQVGTKLASKEPRPCGLCGDVRRLSRTHVPPQAAGNTGLVTRAADIIENGIRRPGRQDQGGLWVRGLCARCNSHAGGRYDRAYADFADTTRRLATPTVSHLQALRSQPPPITFAPGLVSRCVLFGMFAIHTRLRLILPSLADDLAADRPALRWPDQVRLRLGLTHGNRALLTGGVFMHRVLGVRSSHTSFADIVYPPFTWSLEATTEGRLLTNDLADASDWPQFSPERANVDIRNLTRWLPAFQHPMLRPNQDDWIELLTDDSVILQGTIRGT